MTRLPIVERLRRCPTALEIEAAAVIEQLVAHIAEQAVHVANRIADGQELGANVWRLALEDVERENRALLVKLADGAPIGAEMAA